MQKAEHYGGCCDKGCFPCSAASNIFTEILLEMQHYCPIKSAYAKILHEMQQSQR